MILLKADSCLLNQHSWGELRLALVFQWPEICPIENHMRLEVAITLSHLRLHGSSYS